MFIKKLSLLLSISILSSNSYVFSLEESKYRSTGPFNSIHLEGPAKLFVTQGEKNGLAIKSIGWKATHYILNEVLFLFASKTEEQNEIPEYHIIVTPFPTIFVDGNVEIELENITTKEINIIHKKGACVSLQESHSFPDATLKMENGAFRLTTTEKSFFINFLPIKFKI